jgi:MFS family permease
MQPRPGDRDHGSGPSAPFRIIAITAAASFLAPLNSSMVAVALPRIKHDFHVGVGPLTLLVSVYLVAVAVAQPVSGRFGDAFGHRRMILAGLAVLFLSSLGAAVAPTFWTLVLTRGVQGVSAAMVMPNGVAYLRRHVDATILGRSLGYNGAAISAGAAMGPVLGGLAVAAAGWRAMFLVNVPAAVIIALWVWSLPKDDVQRPARMNIDGVSLAALALAFAGLVAIGNAARVHQPALAVGALAILPVAVAGYLLRYRQKGTGVVELRLFGRRDYAVAGASTALNNLVMYTTLIAMPIYLDELRGVGEAGIGLILFSLSVATVVVSPLSGNLSDRHGYRLPAVIGAAVLLGSAVLLAAMVGHFGAWTVVFPLAAMGVGMGIVQASLQSAALRAWGTEVAGSASGTQSMMRYVGSVAGTALLAATLGSHPSMGDVRLLLVCLSGVAVLNFLVSFAMGRRPSATQERAAQTSAARA